MQFSHRFHKQIPLFFNSAKKILFFGGNISEQTDEELLQHHMKSGRTEYFDELYNRYTSLLYGVRLEYLKNEAWAQDAVMGLSEDLFPKVTYYEIKTSRTWTYRAVKNHCLQILRKDSKEVSLDYIVHIVESGEFLYLLCEEESNADQLEALHHCLKELSEPQRVSIWHFFIEEMSYAGTVVQTGFTLNNARSYIQNGKRNLKICIKNQPKE